MNGRFRVRCIHVILNALAMSLEASLLKRSMSDEGVMSAVTFCDSSFH